MEVVFQRAGMDRVDEVLSVLDEAAGWLNARGISQWPAHFEAAWVEEAISRGETWLVTIEDKVAGTVSLDWADPLWADADGAAGYVHRMAVRRWAAGLGARVLDWAADVARQRNAAFLRLDCVKSNDRLRAYYEARGFAHRGDVPVGGAPGQRLGDGPVTWVSRYELALSGRWSSRPLPSRDRRDAMPVPGVEIRHGRGDDVDRLLSFWRKAAEGASITDDRDGVRRLLDRDAAAVLIAEVDREVVGTVIAGWDGWRCHLYRLAVSPEHRRRGIANALLAAAERRFISLGGRRGDAMVLDGNTVAHHAWKAAGYSPDTQWSRWTKPLT